MGALRYSDEFKQQAVRHYRSAWKSYKELGRNLGASGCGIRTWGLEQQRLEASPNAVPESEELERLRCENCILREERESGPLPA